MRTWARMVGGYADGVPDCKLAIFPKAADGWFSLRGSVESKVIVLFVVSRAVTMPKAEPTALVSIMMLPTAIPTGGEFSVTWVPVGLIMALLEASFFTGT